jgi:peptidoglycan pentaglycine glycine transferase (the first glycine)
MPHRYLLRAAQQREEWDAFVDAHPWGHFLQSWGWGELKASAGWRPLRLAFWDMEREEMVAAAQVLRRSPAHVPPRLGHLAYIPRGPVLNWYAGDASVPTPHPHSPRPYEWGGAGDASVQVTQTPHPHSPRPYGWGGAGDPTLRRDAIYRALFSQLNPLMRKQGAIALHVELPQEVDGVESDNARAYMAAMQFHPVHPIQPLRTILLDLNPEEETLLAGMKEKWRYNIRLAGRKGVQVRVAQTIEDVRAWYALLQTTSIRDQFGIHTFDYYRRAWQIFVPGNQAQLFLAEHEGLLLAGIFVGCMAKQAIYLYGASSNEQRNLMPNYLLQWEAIRWAKRQGASTYDFWGIPETDDENEAMAGVYRFKSGWGGRVVRFAGNYEYLYHPLMMRIARNIM